MEDTGNQGKSGENDDILVGLSAPAARYPPRSSVPLSTRLAHEIPKPKDWQAPPARLRNSVSGRVEGPKHGRVRPRRTKSGWHRCAGPPQQRPEALRRRPMSTGHKAAQERETSIRLSGGPATQQLCTHFGHKRTVTFDAYTGHIEFDAGSCELLAPEGEDTLTLRILAETEVSRDRLADVMARHLERFAFNASACSSSCSGWLSHREVLNPERRKSASADALLFVPAQRGLASGD